MRRILGAGAHELGLGAVDVYHGMKADGLRDHAAPTAFESARDVGLRLGRRRRRKQEWIFELDPGESHRSIHTHTASD